MRRWRDLQCPTLGAGDKRRGRELDWRQRNGSMSVAGTDRTGAGDAPDPRSTGRSHHAQSIRSLSYTFNHGACRPDARQQLKSSAPSPLYDGPAQSLWSPAEIASALSEALLTARFAHSTTHPPSLVYSTDGLGHLSVSSLPFSLHPAVLPTQWLKKASSRPSRSSLARRNRSSISLTTDPPSTSNITTNPCRTLVLAPLSTTSCSSTTRSIPIDGRGFGMLTLLTGGITSDKVRAARFFANPWPSSSAS